jgi:hypothetical protein
MRKQVSRSNVGISRGLASTNALTAGRFSLYQASSGGTSHGRRLWNGDAYPILQIAAKKIPELSNVSLALDVAKTDEARQLLKAGPLIRELLCAST